MNLPDKLALITKKHNSLTRRLSAYQALAALDRKDIKKNREDIDEVSRLMYALSCMVLALCVLTLFMVVIHGR